MRIPNPRQRLDEMKKPTTADLRLEEIQAEVDGVKLNPDQVQSLTRGGKIAYVVVEQIVSLIVVFKELRDKEGTVVFKREETRLACSVAIARLLAAVDRAYENGPEDLLADAFTVLTEQDLPNENKKAMREAAKKARRIFRLVESLDIE